MSLRVIRSNRIRRQHMQHGETRNDWKSWCSDGIFHFFLLVCPSEFLVGNWNRLQLLLLPHMWWPFAVIRRYITSAVDIVSLNKPVNNKTINSAFWWEGTYWTPISVVHRSSCWYKKLVTTIIILINYAYICLLSFSVIRNYFLALIAPNSFFWHYSRIAVLILTALHPSSPDAVCWYTSIYEGVSKSFRTESITK